MGGLFGEDPGKVGVGGKIALDEQFGGAGSFVPECFPILSQWADLHRVHS